MKYAVYIGLLLASVPVPMSAERVPFEIVLTPADKDSLAPNLCAFGDHLALSWIERNRDGNAQVHFADWNGNGFNKKIPAAVSRHMFSNWADIPTFIEAPTGDLYAHWLDRIDDKPHAYGIRVEHSADRGKKWNSLGWLHTDTSATEHGFVSLVPDGNHVRAFWLDGRLMTKPTGKMTLRTVILDGDQIRDERMLDDNVCTCCPTSAVPLPAGPIVVYRDRSLREIRDISFILRSENKWTEPATLKKDNWLMPGCPVNGASIATNGDLVAVSRFTVRHKKAQVILRLYNGGLMQTGKDVVLDKNTHIGRCSTVCSKNSTFTVWIGFEKKQAVLRLAEVSPTGKIKSNRTLTPVKGNRSSGMPRTILSDGFLWVTWTDSNRIRLGRIKVN